MLRESGASLAKPAALSLRHRFAAQRVLADESRAFELLFNGGELSCRLGLILSRGDLTGQGDDESESVLQIVQLDLGHEPFPIQVRIVPGHPGQCFTESRFQVGCPQCGEEELHRVDSVAPLEMCESRVSQGTKGVRECLRVARFIGQFDR